MKDNQVFYAVKCTERGVVTPEHNVVVNIRILEVPREQFKLNATEERMLAVLGYTVKTGVVKGISVFYKTLEAAIEATLESYATEEQYIKDMILDLQFCLDELQENKHAFTSSDSAYADQGC